MSLSGSGPVKVRAGFRFSAIDEGSGPSTAPSALCPPPGFPSRPFPASSSQLFP
jgi:hypothetical protein